MKQYYFYTNSILVLNIQRIVLNRYLAVRQGNLNEIISLLYWCFSLSLSLKQVLNLFCFGFRSSDVEIYFKLDLHTIKRIYESTIWFPKTDIIFYSWIYKYQFNSCFNVFFKNYTCPLSKSLANSRWLVLMYVHLNTSLLMYTSTTFMYILLFMDLH